MQIHPFLHKHFGMLMHDSKISHTAARTRQFLTNQNVHVLPWPANFPDMNPIEHIWDICLGVGQIDYRPSIETLNLVLPFGSYRWLFANFENDPYSLQRLKYTSHPEISIDWLIDWLTVLRFNATCVSWLSNMLLQRWEVKIRRKQSSPHTGIERTTTRSWIRHAHHWAIRMV